MIESLQQFSVPDVSGVLITVAILWGIWPVLCGAFGATRGQTVQGVVHGFLWGPIGLLIVLLSSRKYECPICGKKTLSQPYDEACQTRFLIPPPIMPGNAHDENGGGTAVPCGGESPRMARPATPVTFHAAGSGASNPAKPALSADTNIPIPSPAAEDGDAKEAERLRAWVNAD